MATTSYDVFCEVHSGNDGFKVEFYHISWPILEEILVEVLKEVSLVVCFGVFVPCVCVGRSERGREVGGGSCGMFEGDLACE